MDFEALANSGLGKELIEHFEKIKDKIADFRYKPEMSKEVRMAVLEVLDEMFVNKLKVLRGEDVKDEGSDDWN